MAFLLAAAIIAATAWGAVKVPVGEVFRIVLAGLLGTAGPDGIQQISTVHQTIIWDLRLPRVILAATVGMGLAVTGATFQGLFNNPMADPHIIGVSQGASFGACLAIYLGISFKLGIVGTVPLFAFIGALATVFFLYFLASRNGKLPVNTLLLAGIAMGTFFSALVSLLVYFSDQQVHNLIFWLLGGFSGRGWDYVKTTLPYILLGTLVIMGLGRELNAMVMGEQAARHLGVRVEAVKLLLFVCGSLLTASAVAASGVIGFVGLIVPHAVRLMAGPDNRILLPGSALLGAIFAVGADLLARMVIAPTEMPVGIITALCGAPFFLYLLRRRPRNGWED